MSPKGPLPKGAYDSAAATVDVILHPLKSLQGVASGVYVILANPSGVGEAVYMKFEEFHRLSAIQQNDLVVGFFGDMIFDAATGKYMPLAMSKALPGAKKGAEVIGKAFSETAKEVKRSGSVTANSGIAGPGDVFYQKLAAQIREVQKSGAGVDIPKVESPVLFENKFPDHLIEFPRQVFSVEQVKRMAGRTLNYVVTETGDLIIGRIDRAPGGGHIDLAKGWPVKAAGEVVIRDGKIKYLDNASGHYEPKGSTARQAAEEAFSKAGFDVEGKYIRASAHNCTDYAVWRE